jgi:hypothetical protein
VAAVTIQGQGTPPFFFLLDCFAEFTPDRDPGLAMMLAPFALVIVRLHRLHTLDLGNEVLQ